MPLFENVGAVIQHLLCVCFLFFDCDMNYGCMLLLCFMAVVTTSTYGCRWRRYQQTPRPHAPYAPIFYPQDYCQQMRAYEEFDWIIVGSGPAGAAVSRRLAENRKMKVLLMEAGDDPTAASDIPAGRGVRPDQLWDMRTQPSDRQCAGFVNKSCSYVLAKFLGGASVVNLMMYNRGNKKDYDEWGSMEGCEGWRWKDIFPFFKKLENYRDRRGVTKPDRGMHGYDGPFVTAPSQMDPQSQYLRVAMHKAFNDYGIPTNHDFNGNSQIGVGEVPGLLTEAGYRENVAKAYLLHLPPNMKVCKNAIVTRVLMDNDKVVSHVEFLHNNATRKVKVRKDVILSGGVLGTPQILERSGIGNSTHLKKAGVDLIHELPGVGESLQEQYTNLGCGFQVEFLTDAARNPLSMSLTSFTLFLNMTDFKHPVPELQWLFLTYNENYMRFNEAISAQFKALPYVLLIGSEVLRQTERGYVHILGTDPTQSPTYDPMQFTSRQEIDLTTKGCQLIRAVMNDPGMKKFNPRPLVLDECKHHEYNSEEEIMCGARLVAFPAYHMAGTAVMGPAKDKMSVVDNKLRVHGIGKLRVCDLSIMPGVPRGNTEVPSIAIGEKCAHLIKAGLH